MTELLGAMAQEGAITAAGGRAEVAAVALPPTLRLTILCRLSFLPEDTLRALRAASILGSGFTVTELSVTMARPAIELSGALSEGMRGRVLRRTARAGSWFRHDLIRDAIYADLPLSVRRGLHREAGERLARSGAPILRVAAQFARGATRGDAEATGWMTKAAREAAATSPDAAADLLERASRCRGNPPSGASSPNSAAAHVRKGAGQLTRPAAAARQEVSLEETLDVMGSEALLAEIREALAELARRTHRC